MLLTVGDAMRALCVEAEAVDLEQVRATRASIRSQLEIAKPDAAQALANTHLGTETFTVDKGIAIFSDQRSRMVTVHG